MVHLQGNSLYFLLVALMRRKELRWIHEGRGFGRWEGGGGGEERIIPYKTHIQVFAAQWGCDFGTLVLHVKLGIQI